jgi:MFS family permease
VTQRRRPSPLENGGLPVRPPTVRLRRVHSLMVAGEASMAIALADSLFLSISPDAARTKVLMFLAISIAPFAVIAPFVGPFIDRIRGGQRMVVIIVGLLRALVLVGMSQSLDSLTLFPLAFAALILGKTYAIAKSAIVPTLISDHDRLVQENGKLGQIAGITGFAVAAPAALLQLISTQATLALGVLAYVFASVNAFRLPKVVIAAKPADRLEIEELHLPSVVNAANAMRILRLCVGFMFFHLAFWLRQEIAGTAWFGLAVGLSGLAVLGANFVGPIIRQKIPEDKMLLGALTALAVGGILATWYDRVLGGIALAAVVNAASAIGKLAFESTVQRDAPDANRGRMFSKFETNNQMAWVAGGLIPVIFSPSGGLGFAVIGAIGVVGLILFVRAGGLSKKSQVEQATDQEPPTH